MKPSRFLRSISALVLTAAVAACSAPSPATPTALSAPARPQAVLEGPVKYVLIITITSADKRGDVVGTIRGTGSVFDLVEGRDPEPSDPSIFNLYVLKPSLLPPGTLLQNPDGTWRNQVQGWVAINTDVPAVVRNEYSQDVTLWRTTTFGSDVSNLTRTQMLNIIKIQAATQGFTHYWHITPGDVLTSGDLLSKFSPL